MVAQHSATRTIPQTFADKALDLARRQREAHGGIFWKTLAVCFSDDHRALVGATYRVESLSSDGWHTVEYDAARDTVCCDCTAAAFNRPCCHAGVAILFGRAAAKAWAGQAEAEAAARLDEAHRGNAAALGY